MISTIHDIIMQVSNADFLHYDIMDGSFVPNISFGAGLVESIKTKLKKDVHLMIDSPRKHVDHFIKAGADRITIHIETDSDLDELIAHLKKKKVKIGLSIKPETKPFWLRYYADKVDLILVMTVEPGKGGQKFNYKMLDKISEIREWFKGDIAVDGGINHETAKMCVLAGANILVTGTYVYSSKDPKETIEELKKI